MAARQTKSDDEFAERVAFTAKLLARRLATADVRRVLVQKYQVSRQNTQTYIRRARQLLLKWSGRRREQHLALSLAVYESVIRESDDNMERIAAQTRIDKLLGLEAPRRREHKVEVSADLTPEGRRARLQGVLDALRRRAGEGAN